MAKPKKRKPEPKPQYNLEIIITLGLFLAFIIYGAGQCNKAKVTKDYEDVQPIALAKDVTAKENAAKIAAKDAEQDAAKVSSEAEVNLPQLVQRYVNKDSLKAIQAGNAYPPGAVVKPRPAQMISSDTKSNGNLAIRTSKTTDHVDMLSKYNRLWVTIDQLKLRSKPSLNSTVLMRLSLFDRVFFLEEETDFKDEINLGKITVNQPWLFVQHENGKKGWVYGAGVNFKKEKNTGVLD